mmetsp:Transcript_6326/g.15988  ORF Transcript_6326/g.15988 Transcript_6326/m.15988 type:complete len:982 (+) Transcript_6326:262-3207(+)
MSSTSRRLRPYPTSDPLHYHDHVHDQGFVGNDNDGSAGDGHRHGHGHDGPSSSSSSPPPPPPPPPIMHPQQHPPQQYPHQQQQQHNTVAVMERVLFTLHERACNYGLRWTSARTRRWLEHFLLVGAIGCFGALLLLHRSFVVVVVPSSSSSSSVTTTTTPTATYNCLPSLPGFDPNKADITHLIVLPAPSIAESLRRLLFVGVAANSNNDSSSSKQNNYEHPTTGGNNDFFDFRRTNSRVIWRAKRNTAETETDESNIPRRFDFYYFTDDNQSTTVHPDDPVLALLSERRSQSSSSPPPPPLYSHFESHYVYSTTKAFLMLPPGHSMLDQLDVQYVFVSPTDQKCFGEPFLQFLIFHCFVGPETILRNWLKQSFLQQQQKQQQQEGSPSLSRLLESDSRGDGPRPEQPSSAVANTKGYLYNTRTEKIQELNTIPWKKNHDAMNMHEDNDDDDKDTMDTHTCDGSCTGSTSTTASWRRQRWIRQLQEFLTLENTGRNERRSFDLRLLFVSLLSKISTLLQTSFLFFFCTTLVSFTLRETQERMMDFTRELSRRVYQSSPVSDLVATHLIQNLVFVPMMIGMMFFLIEFYGGDKYLAFSVSSIVWTVESFSIVSLRSRQGLLYFPRFFFLLFLLFHVYQSAYSQNGFVYLALTVVWCFIFHSMVFFWHRFELPAVVFGYVSVDRPRMTMTHRTPDPTHTSSTPIIIGRQTQQPQQNEEMRSSNSSSNLMHTDPHSIGDTGIRPSSGRGGPGVPSHPSFSTTSSRNGISGLFRNNHDDDNSTGSMLYFMGGEVVVHRGMAVRTTSNGSVDGTNTSDASRRNVAASGVPATSVIGPNLNIMNRTDSNLSLPSTLSHGAGHTTPMNSSTGLDIFESNREDEYQNVTATESSDTFEASNATPSRGHRMTADQPADYTDESGGSLQAILESRLTPRHRNCSQLARNRSLQEAPQQDVQHQQTILPTGSSYQRTPPTFPELADGEKKQR